MTPATTGAMADLHAEYRHFVWSLCYRMLGSAADAEEVVKETFARATKRTRKKDAALRPRLVEAALTRSRDVLQRRRRSKYVGPWLPSPIDTGGEAAPPAHEPGPSYEILESVSFAFLLALEALTPAQRGVLLLRDVFDYSVKDAADALDVTQTSVKTTHLRARQAMKAYDRRRHIPTTDAQGAARATLTAFLFCLEHHDVRGIEALLAEKVRTIADGGGEFQAALRPIVGRDKVARFYQALAGKGSDLQVRMAILNGMPGAVATVPSASGREAPRFALTVDIDGDGRISCIYLVSATRKLTALEHS